MHINSIVRGEKVEFIEGDYKGKIGIFKRITGYTDGYGCVCEILIDNFKLEFTSDFFNFVNPEIQNKWDDDNYDFKLDA